MCHFGDAGVLCTFSNIPAAAVAGIARSSQLSSKGSQAVRPAQHTANHRPSTLGRAGRRVGSFLYGIRPLCGSNQFDIVQSIILHEQQYTGGICSMQIVFFYNLGGLFNVV